MQMEHDAIAWLPEEWEQMTQAWGLPKFRAKQIFHWIHARGVLDVDAMSNLPKELRPRLREAGVAQIAELAEARRAQDNTRKGLVRFADQKDVETVLIPQLRDITDEDDSEAEVLPGRIAGTRVTQCISSQVGCAMGCVFCASGIAGLKRHLSAAEIVVQVLLGRAALEGDEQLRNVVFMGMGEPLHNYEAVKRALLLLTHPDGIALSRRRVTVSTSGLVPEIERLGRDFDGRVALAISLHCVDNDRRSEIMPINKKYPLPMLMETLRAYPMPKRSRITIEYTLIRGVNDSRQDAKELARLLKGVRAKVNLIPMNPVTDSPLGAPDWAAVEAFQSELHERKVACTIRTQRGDDIAAACGQLALHGEERKVKMKLPTMRG